jgi:hypothetical protein
LKRLAGVKSTRTSVMLRAVTSSTCSAPSLKTLTRKVPKSPSSTILPLASSAGTTFRKDYSTAAVSMLLTVDMLFMLLAVA